MSIVELAFQTFLVSKRILDQPKPPESRFPGNDRFTGNYFLKRLPEFRELSEMLFFALYSLMGGNSALLLDFGLGSGSDLFRGFVVFIAWSVNLTGIDLKLLELQSDRTGSIDLWGYRWLCTSQQQDNQSISLGPHCSKSGKNRGNSSPGPGPNLRSGKNKGELEGRGT